MVADVGQTDDSATTYQHLLADTDVVSIIHAGDMSYADCDQVYYLTCLQPLIYHPKHLLLHRIVELCRIILIITTRVASDDLRTTPTITLIILESLGYMGWLVEPLASKVPYMVAVGNHELDTDHKTGHQPH